MKSLKLGDALAITAVIICFVFGVATFGVLAIRCNHNPPSPVVDTVYVVDTARVTLEVFSDTVWLPRHWHRDTVFLFHHWHIDTLCARPDSMMTICAHPDSMMTIIPMRRPVKVGVWTREGRLVYLDK